MQRLVLYLMEAFPTEDTLKKTCELQDMKTQMRMLTDRMTSKATDLAHLSSSLSELTSHLHLGGFNN